MNQPNPILFIPCEKSCADRFTGEVHLIGIMDVVHPLPVDEQEMHISKIDQEGHGVILVYPPFSVMTEWAISEISEDIKIKQNVWIIAPDKREVEIGKLMEFSMKGRRHRIFQGTSHIAARMTGEYFLDLRASIGETEEMVSMCKFPVLFMDRKSGDSEG